MGRFLLLAGLVVLLAAQAAWAHPPAKIDIVYDAEGKVLAAVVTHPVDNPAAHFIRKINVSLNGEEIIRHEISRQDSANTQTVTYRVPDAKSGDTISVEAYCNLDGKLGKDVTVP
jgi:desulfoferrodoxin (superoxide reductase-like protein)